MNVCSKGRRIDEVHQPSIVKVVQVNADYAHIDYRYGIPLVARKDTGPPKWVRHACDQYIATDKKGAAQFNRFYVSQETIGLVDISAITNVGELNKSNVAIRVLIFTLDPIAIDKNTSCCNKIG